jgi:hypothetical protein
VLLLIRVSTPRICKIRRVRIPKFWTRQEGDVRRPDGSPIHLFAWGWSETSTGEAQMRARERFQSLQQRVAGGLELPRGYAYGSRPVREQILDEIPGPAGEPDALLTRNGYGSVVLNTARSMFVDVDVDTAAQGGGFSLGKLFGRGGGGGQDAQLDRLRTAVTGAGAGSFRVYKTAAGFRLLATDRLFTPASADAETVMRAVGADPAFIQLCRVQQSFRARLTPKPWRVGQTAPPGDFPRDDPDQQAAFSEWLQKYERASESKATCRFVETIGSGSVHRDVEPLMRLHDDKTKANTELPLA